MAQLLEQLLAIIWKATGIQLLPHCAYLSNTFYCSMGLRHAPGYEDNRNSNNSRCLCFTPLSRTIL